MAEIPEEFLSRLSGDLSATMRFSGLDEQEKDEIIERARNAKSAHELDHIVSRL